MNSDSMAEQPITHNFCEFYCRVCDYTSPGENCCRKCGRDVTGVSVFPIWKTCIICGLMHREVNDSSICPECERKMTVDGKPDNPTSPNHYAKYSIEPLDAIEAWDLPFHLGNVVKYVVRHRDKGGIEDLKKARVYLDRYITMKESK